MEELLEEGAAGQPHPAARVHAEVRVQEQLIEHLGGAGWGISLQGHLLRWLSPGHHMPRGEKS